MTLCKELTLVRPSLAFQAAYAAMVREFLETDEAWFNNFPLTLEDFPAFVRELEDEAHPTSIETGLVLES